MKISFKNGKRKKMKMKRGLVIGFLLLFSLITLSPAVSMTAAAEDIVYAGMGEETVHMCNIYHTHVGDPSTNGGCYTTPAYCGGSYSGGITGWYGWWRYDNNTALGCQQCGRPSNNHGGNTHSVSHYTCNRCGAGSSYNPGYCTNTYGYGLSCGLGTNTLMGTLNLVKSRSATSYTLTPVGVYQHPNLVFHSFVWTGGVPNVATVTGNGTYTCTIGYTDRGFLRSVAIPISITDFDNTPPTINSFTVTPTARTAGSVTVKVNATDASGVASYSMDGANFQASDTFTLSANGTYSFYAKDIYANASTSSQITINNIDKEAPTISISYQQPSGQVEM